MHQQPRDRSEEDSLFSQGRLQAAELDPEALAMAAPSDPLDDVFGADNDAHPHDVAPPAPASTHPTDMSRLQAEHSTAGYREGVSVAKEASIQPGFDEGFSLGATIGQAAGHLLGLLEGISEALAPAGGDAAAEAERLLGQAREELSTGCIFSPDYWAPDGNWTYPVGPTGGQQRETEEEEEEEGGVLFPDVAAAHPLIRKWTGVVDGQVKRWNIRLDILRDETGPRMEVISDEQTKSSLVQKTNKALDW
ncbi:ABC1 domain containing protein [Cordyceps fumosorosea ARSEF 2679]|uniref:Protein YAE1 n=1 Tax=Cordyceps fumosorosea (strain ARSEF 2679) TaxID=1081104 RepID=A0A167NM84_CORFA|nr:ABC1 domain containing protein [Cordyceps fumosorosea ARSEF 2679]OAA55709.1 ABC1 domain containing protein [Cordyceps fumosorosea ARSEF 2679]